MVIMGNLNSVSDNTIVKAAAKRILDAFFPDYPNQKYPVFDVQREQVPLLSEAEMVGMFNAYLVVGIFPSKYKGNVK